jgi:hypothetical protein
MTETTIDKGALEAAVEAAIKTKIDGVTSFEDWVSISDADARELGVLKTDEHFHVISDVRGDQLHWCYEELLTPILKAAIAAYLAALPVSREAVGVKAPVADNILAAWVDRLHTAKKLHGIPLILNDMLSEMGQMLASHTVDTREAAFEDATFENITRAEFAETVARYGKALHRIGGGHDPRLSDMVIAGNWQGVVNVLQEIAKTAIGPTPPHPQTGVL